MTYTVKAASERLTGALTFLLPTVEACPLRGKPNSSELGVTGQVAHGYGLCMLPTNTPGSKRFSCEQNRSGHVGPALSQLQPFGGRADA